MVAIRVNMDTGPLERALKTGARLLEDDVDTLTRNRATRLANLAVINSPVDTGRFRAAWDGPRKLGWAHYIITNATSYGPVIEFGGYRGVGPKTQRVGAHVLPEGVSVNRGIFSTSGAVAPLRRAISQVASEIRSDIRKAGL